jgi:hypothetical protein
MNKTASGAHFVVCVNNRGYSAALEVRKLYRRVTDSKATRMGMIRVVDESGEDYLYPAGFFMPVRLSAAIVRALRRRR